MEKLKALLVDDSKIIQRINGLQLEKLGIEIKVASNGKEAIDIVHNHGISFFDLIVMDRDMPIMNGIEATRELREMGVKCGIVGVSSRIEEVEKKEFIEAGLNDFHEKPLNDLKLHSILQNLNLHSS